ncbi:hypothetical protein GCM10009610_47540 [Pseudonocardia xinjiangensis]
MGRGSVARSIRCGLAQGTEQIGVEVGHGRNPVIEDRHAAGDSTIGLAERTIPVAAWWRVARDVISLRDRRFRARCRNRSRAGVGCRRGERGRPRQVTEDSNDRGDDHEGRRSRRAGIGSTRVPLVGNGPDPAAAYHDGLGREAIVERIVDAGCGTQVGACRRPRRPAHRPRSSANPAGFGAVPAAAF